MFKVDESLHRLIDSQSMSTPVKAAMFRVRVPRRWIVCASCCLVFTVSGITTYCYYGVYKLITSVKNRGLPPSTGCPFLFSSSPWLIQKTPLVLPSFLWLTWSFHSSLYSVGFVVSSVPAGLVSDVGYSKYVLCGGLLIEGINFSILPLLAYSTTTVLVHYFIGGMCFGIVYSSIASLVAHWAEPSERGIYIALILSSSSIGLVLGQPFFQFTYLGFKSYTIGQVSVGTLHLLCLPLLWITIQYSPQRRSNTTRQTSSYVAAIRRLLRISWREIACSVPLIVLTFAYFSIFEIAATNIAGVFKRYQKLILHLPDAVNQSTTVIDLADIAAYMIGGYFFDFAVKHRILTITVATKTIIIFSVVLSSLLLVGAVLVGCNIVWFWSLAISSSYILSLSVPATCSALLELSPRNAGLLAGLVTGSSQIVTLFVFTVSNRLIFTEYYYFYRWTNWFITTLLVSIVACTMTIPFLIFGSVSKQTFTRSTPVYDRSVLQNVQASEQPPQSDPVL